MATFVLIHGAWHGGWCWYKVVARLQAAGHQVLAPDLAGLGRDTTPLQDVTLARWVDQVAALVASQPDPVVLVGHSRGGIIVSEVAERLPERIAHAVYLAAFMVQDGQSLMDIARTNTASKLAGATVFDAATRSTTVREELIAPTFYAGCSADDVALASLLLRPEPAAPMATPLALTAARYGRVPRTYIECEQDQAVSLDVQRAMQQAQPGTRVVTLPTDHSPFLSAPDALCAHLLALA
jgi:pimeloyl-ACP methyl ester carboxylesterase